MSLSHNTPTFDLVFLFGPPLFDKSSYLPESFFREAHIKIVPSKLFEDNPAFGLRDVSLQIISELKKGTQVFIEDELHSQNTRKSILKTVKKKVQECRVLLVKIIPAHGLFQVLWTHQNANGRGLLHKYLCQNKKVNAERWFDSSLCSINYQSGYVDEPDQNEGFEIEEINAIFQIQSNFKFEFPALFIQWEAAVLDSGDVNMILYEVCEKWIALNNHGRIVLIYSGNKDLKLGSKERNAFLQKLKQFALRVHQPVYLVKLMKSTNINRFCLPPQPGILAFLQAQHLINLQGKHTMYIFETTDHMKMAQAAGVKHIKSTKAFRNPEQILSSLCVNPSVPVMLKDVKFVKSDDGDEKASIPLLDECEDNVEGVLSHSYQDGFEELVFVPSAGEFSREESLVSLVTPINTTGSKTIPQELDSLTCTSKTNHKTLETKKSTSVSVWMKQRLKRKSTESSLSDLDSNDQESSFRFIKTVYIMSEKEIKEIAVQVINQAGKSVQESSTK